MKVRDLCEAMETIAPPHLAAEWDNVGLIVGDGAAEVKRALVCIDLTAEVLAEAAKAGAQMVVAYHPVIFKPLSRVTAEAAPVVHEAAARGIAVYAAHTALDAAPGGTNDVLADAMGLTDCRPLAPSAGDRGCKIVVFTPPSDVSRVAEAAFAVGAGHIGRYFDCAYFGHGIGTFCGGEGTSPAVGQVGQHEFVEEVRLEMVAPADAAAHVCEAIRAAHSYEQPAIDVYPLRDHPAGCGMGRVGRLRRPVTVRGLIGRIKKAVGVGKVLLAGAGAMTDVVATGACGAGSAGGMFRAAIAAGATCYLTGEMRHHDALAATAAGLTVVCVGHSNSERIALASVAQRLGEMCQKLRIDLSRRDRDPFEIV